MGLPCTPFFRASEQASKSSTFFLSFILLFRDCPSKGEQGSGVARSTNRNREDKLDYYIILNEIATFSDFHGYLKKGDFQGTSFS